MACGPNPSRDMSGEDDGLSLPDRLGFDSRLDTQLQCFGGRHLWSVDRDSARR